MNQLYKEINVFERQEDGTLACYRCIELLNEGKFCVQSADFFRRGEEVEALTRSTRQFIERLIEVEPELWTNAFSSLQEAIMAHKSHFAN